MHTKTNSIPKTVHFLGAVPAIRSNLCAEPRHIGFTAIGADGLLSGKSTYQNPIFGGDYPDPSPLREAKDYY